MNTNAICTLLSTALTFGVTPKMRNALSVIEPKAITDPLLREIFNGITQLDKFNNQVSIITVDEHLKNVDFGTLGQLASTYPPTDDPFYYAQSFTQSHKDVLSVKVMQQAIEILSSDRAFNREDLSVKIRKVSEDLISCLANTSGKPELLAEYADAYVDQLDDRINGKPTDTLDIGLEVDINKTDLVVVGGQPSINLQVDFAA